MSLILEIRLFRDDMLAARKEMQELRDTVSTMTSTLNTCNTRIDELTERVNVLEVHRMTNSDSGISALQQQISDLKIELNGREQEMLCNDVELSGIPEEASESILHIVRTVANKLGMTLEDQDSECGTCGSSAFVSRECYSDPTKVNSCTVHAAIAS